MSANRSVQAAQRRRAGPANGEPAIPGRSPQPSINSAQMFANQARPGSGPNIPTGRLAGQQAAMQQQNQNKSQPQQNKLSSVTKMTIPQAITLITLRLGVIESKLNNSENSEDMMFKDSEIDPGFLQSIMTRLEELEKRPINPEINLLKQQMETIKQSVIQTKNSNITLVKENTTLKTQIELLKNNLTETKGLVEMLQHISMENGRKILELTMETNAEYGQDDGIMQFYNNDALDDSKLHNNKLENNELENDELEEIVGNNLKHLIESELHIGL